MSITTIVLIAVGIVVLMIIIMYNSLIGKKNRVDNALGSIDVMLKKRYDLIPNLVAMVQQYMKHEKSVLTEITALRARAVNQNISPDEKVELDNKITGALSGIFVAVENYPDLKANQNFLQLQGSLNEIEEQISAARRAYNASVTEYNNAVEMFPTSIFASMMSYKRRNFFTIPEVERQNVNVRDLFQS